VLRALRPRGLTGGAPRYPGRRPWPRARLAARRLELSARHLASLGPGPRAAATRLTHPSSPPSHWAQIGDPDTLDAVFVAIGGGGLIAGIAAYLKQLKPHILVIGVEPSGANAMAQSLERGERVALAKVDAFADGVAVKQVRARERRGARGGGRGGKRGAEGALIGTGCGASALHWSAASALHRPGCLCPGSCPFHHLPPARPPDPPTPRTPSRSAWRPSGSAASWWTA
jgi:hypothetical protein